MQKQAMEINMLNLSLFLLAQVAFAGSFSVNDSKEKILKLESEVSRLTSEIGKADRTMKKNNKAIASLNHAVSSLQNKQKKEKQYLGCYLDDGHRMLKDKYIFSDQMTVTWCIIYCRELNKNYAGLESTSSCFCGNSMNTARYHRAQDGDCNYHCAGDNTERCGGAWRLSVYRLS